jgi:hypothetical protein
LVLVGEFVGGASITILFCQEMKRNALVDLEDLGEAECAPGKGRSKKCKASQAPKIIRASVRNDLPANQAQLDEFLSDLEFGARLVPNPRFGHTEKNSHYDPVSLLPEDVQFITWWSKDFGNFIKAWDSDKWQPLLRRYRHHFNFTICSSTAHNRIEPGMESDLAERLGQLDRLAQIVATTNPDTDLGNSIGVRVDPLYVYFDRRLNKRVVVDEHVQPLMAKMAELGLRRLHISFVGFGMAPKAIAAREELHEIKFEVLERKSPEINELIDTVFGAPASEYGIVIESCYLQPYNTGETRVVAGGCVPVEGAKAIAREPDRVKPGHYKDRKDLSSCYCAEMRDIGTYYPACKHGCLMCFATK